MLTLDMKKTVCDVDEKLILLKFMIKEIELFEAAIIFLLPFCVCDNHLCFKNIYMYIKKNKKYLNK